MYITVIEHTMSIERIHLWLGSHEIWCLTLILQPAGGWRKTDTGTLQTIGHHEPAQ